MKDEVKINSVSDYIRLVVEKTMKAEPREEYQTFWFRGEANIDWSTSLVPNSYRVLADTFKQSVDDSFISQHVKQIEKNMSSEFYRKATPFINAKRIENSNWNRYFLMQHYKVNTRLLDWTENALLALFFAVSDNDEIKNDAVVWILQPLKLNDFTIQQIIGEDKHVYVIPHGVDSNESKNIINDKSQIRLDELTRRYLRMDFEKKEDEENEYTFYPLAIYPTYLDERISNQKGCFTIFGNKINGLKSAKNNTEFIDKVVISGGKTKNEILKELRLIGIDFSSIYPDLDGLGISIKSKYKNEFHDNRETMYHVLKNLKVFKTE
jgi:hypothetical protein